MSLANNKEDIEIDFLEKIIPDLRERKILEIGSGRGEFLSAMKARGYGVVGVEPDPYKGNTQALLAKGETLPFEPGSFDFVYCNNVIEHCQDPIKLLQETRRVLRPSGLAYFTVINRLAFRDPHYHLNFLNWLPRSLAEKYIALRGRTKVSLHHTESRNKLSEMHYFTFIEFKKTAERIGFTDVRDLKEYKIKHPELITASRKSWANLAKAFPFVYPLARLFYISGFRLLMRKIS